MFQHIRGEGWTEPPGELDSESTLVVVFGGSDYIDDQEPFAELAAAYPQSEVVGCSTSGEIGGRKLLDDSLSVVVLAFDDTDVRVAQARVTDSTASEGVGRSLADQLIGDDLAAVFVLSNGLNVNGTALVAGMNSLLPEGVITTGGLAGDGEAFEQTWVLRGDDAALDRTVAVGFYGDNVVVTHGSQGGWDRFGPERRVTRSQDNVLFELDGQPALDLYKRYLGDHAAELPAAGLLFPLEIHQPDDPGKRLVRTILAVDEDNHSLTFAGDIPEGWIAQLMKANFDRLVDGAESAAEALGTDRHGRRPVCFAISCVGRRLVLRERTEDEIEAVADLLPEEARLAGFYSYGELSPHIEGEPCDLHNQTMTLTLISERT
jgi:hypothetical protein